MCVTPPNDTGAFRLRLNKAPSHLDTPAEHKEWAAQCIWKLSESASDHIRAGRIVSSPHLAPQVEYFKRRIQELEAYIASFR